MYAGRAGIDLPKISKKTDGTILEATYSYQDEHGALSYQVLRYRYPDCSKTFRQRAPASEQSGGWIWSIKGLDPLPYRLPELLRRTDDTIYVVEGEKDVERAFSVGLLATTNHGGTGSGKAWEHLTKWFADRTVVILPDNDPVGIAHASKVAGHLAGVARSAKVLHLSELPLKGDLCDWLDAGHTADELAELGSKAAEWTPTVAVAKSEGSPPAVPPWVAVAAPEEEGPPEGPYDPHLIARTYLADHQTHPDGLTLRMYLGQWHRWDGECWQVAPDENEIKGDIVLQIKRAHDAVAKISGKSPLPVTTKSRSNAMMALESLALLKRSDCPESPCWLDKSKDLPNPVDVLAASNCLVDLNRVVADGPKAIFALTPKFFSHSNLGYPFETDCPAPVAWLHFLDTLWGEDHESINLVQEWFGYCLAPDTRQQKMLMLIGPPRSGKGTIGRILRRLVGRNSTAAPTLSSLGGSGDFGCSPLIGKSVAIFGDAHLSGRADKQAIVERLLSITGEDAQTINRKNLSHWTGDLTVRFMLISNELPHLGNASGALPSRFLILRLIKTFINEEDLELDNKLLPELPAILLWAIAGRHRLQQRGRFKQPASGQELVDEMKDLSSPATQWLNECAELGGGYEITRDAAFASWTAWSEAQGVEHTGNKAAFFRQLYAAAPSIRAFRTQRGGKNIAFCIGIRLRSEDDAGPAY
jgi:P4 family phage/plasmid primase-like protien